jgi:hypothetical protein
VPGIFSAFFSPVFREGNFMRGPSFFSSRTLVVAGIAAFALSACGGSPSAMMPASSNALQSAALMSQKPAPPLKVTPKALNFTVKPTLVMTISEAQYKGKFKVTVSPAKIVKIKPAKLKGPSVKVNIAAVAAGKAAITVTDDHGGSKTVKVTVTQGVIIIQ